MSERFWDAVAKDHQSRKLGDIAGAIDNPHLSVREFPGGIPVHAVEIRCCDGLPPRDDVLVCDNDTPLADELRTR